MRIAGEEKAQEESALKRGAKNVAKKQAKKLGKKALKKYGKVATKAAAKAGLAAVKAVISFLIGLGAPLILTIIGVLLFLVLVLVATAMLFSWGESTDLESDAYELKEYIQQASYNSVDQSKPEQRPYQVPPELIVSAMQIYEANSEKSASSKEAVDLFVEALKPTFNYEMKEGLIESEQTTCKKGKCDTVKTKTPFEMNLFTSVQAWDRTMQMDNTAHFNDWQESVLHRTDYEKTPVRDEDGNIVPGEYWWKPIPYIITTKVRSQTFVSTPAETMDYSYFDTVLRGEPFNYGQTDIQMVEAIYMATGGDIRYSEWASGNSFIGFGGTVVPGSSIPTEFMEVYLAAEKAYQVEWYYLAAFHYVETAFSTHPTMISSAGAVGHMQFLPCTWVGWGYPGCQGNGSFQIPEKDMKNPIIIQKYGGYGIDADKNGKASPWEIKDAIFATARYMNAMGWQRGKDAAIFNYNRSHAYVDKINKYANKFKSEATLKPADGEIPKLVPGSFMRPTVGRNTSGYGPRSLGARSFHYGIDIASTTAPPVVAVADGVVTRSVTGCPPNGRLGSTCGGGWGNHLWVKFNVGGRSYEAVYGHLSRVAVSNGQTVKQGQMIGNMGNSGSSTGMHLHFELHSPARAGNSNVLNPALYIPMN